MAWTNVPAPTGTDIPLYPWVIQFWQAARKRAWAAGAAFWPRTNHAWTQGSVYTLTDNGNGTYTLTDNAASYLPAVNNRWFGYSDVSAPTIPPYYDLVFDDDDETKVARSPILGSTISGATGTYLLDTAALQAFVDSKQIPSIASLATKKYYVIVRGGLWWSDRWIEWPNDREHWKGTATASTTTGITDTAAAWSASQWDPAGGTNYELMIAGKRIAITGNTATTIAFAAQAAAPSGTYAVVTAGARWRNQKPGQRRAWYRGGMLDFYSHYPDGSIQGTHEVQSSVTLSFGLSCASSFTQNIFDYDFWTELDDPCNTPDHTYGPDLFKTFRGIQLFIETICSNFVDLNLTYDANASIPYFVPATFFKAAGINAYATTVTALAGDGITIPAQTFPFTPVAVYWAVLDAAGNVQNFGNGTASSTTHITGTFNAPDVGLTLVLSLGWTRYRPREFRYYYDAEHFIPGISTGALGDPAAGLVVDPPTSATPGLWKFRPKSTTYLDHTIIGIVQEGAEAYVDQEVARYYGDNWNDPTIHDPLIAVVGGDATLLNYYDNFYTQKRGAAQAALEAMPSGKSTGGSTTQLQDTAAHWWANVMRTESGTADGGSTTSLSDSTKAGNGLWDATTGRWVGFVVEVTISGTVYRRPITSFSGTTISWTEPLPSSASGKSYQIREPGVGSSSVVGYELNRYAGRTLTVTDPATGGATYTIPILYSDDNTLYFAAQAFTIGANWPYSIGEAKPGGVWKWDAAHTKWIVPTGNDPRTGTPWLVDQTADLPYKHKDFGRVIKRDYFGPHIVQELFNAFEQLKWTAIPITWDPRANDAVPENNHREAHDGSYTSFAASVTFADAAWGGASGGGIDTYSGASSEVGGAPFALGKATRFVTPTPFWRMELSRQYAYAVVAPISPKLNSAIEYYVYGTIDAADDPADSTHIFDANGDTVGYHLWKKFDSAAAANTTSRKSSAFGSLAVPDAPPEPAAVDGATTVQGYNVGNALAILKWDMSAGGGG
jgi:hypothetical protein